MWWNRRQSESERFLDLLRKSGLLEDEEIRRASRGIDTKSLEMLTSHFVQRGFITQWQCEKLKEGRYKGFFLERYVLQEHLRKDDTTTTYLAVDSTNNRKVGVRITPPSGGTSVRFEIVDP